MLKQTVFGEFATGKEASVFTLEAGGVTVRVSDLGATVLGIDVPDARGNVADIALGFAGVPGYLGVNDAFYGATAGPVANRTARAEVPIDGVVYHLPVNDADTNNLHTDKVHGLHKRLWTVDAAEEAPTGPELRLSCELADGEFGLPGNRRVTAVYALSNQGVLTLTYGMETDAPTYANITNHTYFNLAGHAAGNVEGQLLQISAERFVPIDATSIPTGELRDVNDTPFDFRQLHAIGEHIADEDEQLENGRGYDHCFCVGGYADGGTDLRHAVHAEDPASGRALDVSISAPGIQLYTGNWLDDAWGVKDGAVYTSRSGFALEPEFYPDSIHHAAWPQTIVTPERPFESVIQYEFTTV